MIYGVHVMSCGGTFCLPQTVRALKDQIIEAGHKAIIQVSVPEVTWFGESTAGLHRRELIEWCRYQRWHVDKRRPLLSCHPSRQEAQGAFRQHAIDMLRDRGAERVLIMDPDELWRPGAFRHLEEKIAAGFPEAYYSRPVPVIGVPGLPIADSLDWALVYVSPAARLVYSRSFKRPHEPSTVRWQADELDTRRMWHLTGTRETLEAVRFKYRQSSHYGEPHYEIQHWLDDVLPHLKPGMTDVSFFSDPAFPRNFWPLVRRFTTDELKEIPKILHEYLDTSTE